MIINNTSVRGIFLYSDDIVFEKGDFVVLNDNLYKCKSETLGISPDESPNYEIYLSGEVASLADFKEYLEGNSSESGSKLVSSALLSQVLSSYMIGFDEHGKINGKVSASGSIILSDYFSNTTTVESTSLNPLDIILEAAQINNAVFSLDPEVVRGVLGTSSVSSSIQSGAILRQYTYKKDDSTYIRVQEIIDYESGNIAIRYSTAGKDSKFSSIGTVWRDSYITSESYTNLINLKNYYIECRNKTILQAMSLMDGFRYHSYTPNFVSALGSISTYSVTIPNPPTSNAFVTFLLMTPRGSSPFSSVDSITLDVISELTYDSNASSSYQIFDGAGYITISGSPQTSSIQVQLNYTEVGYITLTGVYGRESATRSFSSSIRGYFSEVISNYSVGSTAVSGPSSYNFLFSLKFDGTGTIPRSEYGFSKYSQYSCIIRYTIGSVSRDILVDLANYIDSPGSVIVGPININLPGEIGMKSIYIKSDFTLSKPSEMLCETKVYFSDDPNVMVPFFTIGSESAIPLTGTALFLNLV